MAWSGFPVTGSTKLNDLAILKQLWLAAWERKWGGGLCYFPAGGGSVSGGAPPELWESGTITAATETTISTGKTWCGGSDDVSGFTYTVPWNCHIGAFYEAPTTWHLCIDDNDPVKCIEVPITSWTNTGVITVGTPQYAMISSLRDYVTSKRIPSIASLVGKKFFIIRGDRGFIWWHNRILEWPQYSWQSGTVQDHTADTPAAPTLTTLKHTIDANKWLDWLPLASSSSSGSSSLQIDFRGKDLLFFGADNYLKRVTVTEQTEDTLKFASAGSIPQIGTAFCIVTAGDTAIPGRDPIHPTSFYRGYTQSYLAHLPDGSQGSVDLPASTVKTKKSDGVGGCDVDETTWDEDRWTEITISPDDQDCGRPAEFPYSLNLYKSLRAIQMIAEECANSNYVEAKSYDAATAIPTMTPAIMFKLAGINYQSCTTGSVVGASGNDGTVNDQIAISGFTMPTGHTSLQVWYAIIWTENRGDDYYHSGRGYMVNASTLQAESGNTFSQQDDTPTPHTPGDNGRTIIISPGWTRWEPRTFKRLYDQDGLFIPDVQTDPISGIKSAVDPASVVNFADTQCFGVGQYIKRGKSTKYIERKHENADYSSAQGFAWETGQDFVTGEYARYEGENATDPNIYSDVSTSGYSQFFKDDSSKLAPYYERSVIAIEQVSYQSEIAKQVYGSASVDSNCNICLTDENQDWFNELAPNKGGLMRKEEGTFSSGSTTSGTDSTKADADPGSPTNDLNCFWHTERFNGFSGPYVGFTVEILMDGGVTDDWDDAQAKIERRLITSSSATAVSVTWATALSASCNGKKYRIKEPYNLNRWKGRKLIINTGTAFPSSSSSTSSSSSGSGSVAPVITTTILGNSDNTLFFADIGQPVTKGMSYTIVDIPVGSVMKWTGSEWIVATGTDAVRAGVSSAHDFRDDPTCNLPTYVKRFGRFLVGDRVGRELYNEMYAALNVLRHVKWAGDWVCCAVDGVAENNCASSGAIDSGCGGLGTGCDGSEDCETAKAAAEALWTPGPCGGAAPYADSDATFSQFLDPCTAEDGCHQYNIERLYSYLEADSICNREACAVDYYDYGAAPGGGNTQTCAGGTEVIFDNFGDTVNYHSWALFGSSSAAIRTSSRSKLGTVVAPTGSYPDGVTCGHRVQGYAVVDQTCILKWDVTGGFVYVTHSGFSMAGAGALLSFNAL